MKVIRNINNNVSLCLDSMGVEVVCFGKGLGFIKPPYEISLDKIERVYYDISDTYIKMLNDLPPDLIRVSTKIIDYAKMKIDSIADSNVVFTLADHLDFAIKRYQQQLNVKLPIIYDVQHLFEKEMEVGKYALRLLRDDLKIYLPKEEAAYIALHIINAEALQRKDESEIDEESVINEIVKIVEKEFQIITDEEESNYSRFVTHMHYLLKRGKKNEQMKTENIQLYNNLIESFPQTYQCVMKVKDYLLIHISLELNEEECLYLMLHINRLCTREEYNQ